MGPGETPITEVPKLCGRFECNGEVTESDDGFWTCDECGQSYGPVGQGESVHETLHARIHAPGDPSAGIRDNWISFDLGIKVEPPIEEHIHATLKEAFSKILDREVNVSLTYEG